ncbi:hypothetical protein [Reinekea blandensis]|uniref:Uncharacterized protein n=1 Tax=Reinekea blandensis MED297 TaxID=314283 RepID=A4BCK1_9GAMM|nr:hypothetical protein [Reinekea blandensis]EAR10267.1 hypothetical protein MED297_13627 [Reinekea sp. MED297] [Reinekea blandensis MED297]
MKLPDFMTFAPFNAMREKIGTDALGYFELFDPTFHLTGQERSDLARTGIRVDSHQLSRLLDFTLVYKNSRVLVKDHNRYHLCVCASFPGEQGTFQISTSEKVFDGKPSVCGDCLQTLHFKGYDATKARKEAYSEQVRERFKLPDYWAIYTQYPISEKRDKRRGLKD